jgi:ribosomal protein L32
MEQETLMLLVETISEGSKKQITLPTKHSHLEGWRQRSSQRLHRPWARCGRSLVPQSMQASHLNAHLANWFSSLETTKAPSRRWPRRIGAFRRSVGVFVGCPQGGTIQRPVKHARVSKPPSKLNLWAQAYDVCIDCGTMERSHRAHGRCKRCDDRWRYNLGHGKLTGHD